jgi:hypothetical protein
LEVGINIFSRSKKSSPSKNDLLKLELTYRISELVPKDLSGLVNGQSYTYQKLISHVGVLADTMLRKSDEELTMFILKSAAGLSSDLHNLSVEDGVGFAVDLAMASLLLRERYSNEAEVLSGVVAFGLLAQSNLEAHPNYEDILIRMTSIANDED